MALGRELELRRSGILARLAEATAGSDLSPLFELFFAASGHSAPLAAYPKGLLPFHWAGDRPRTAFEEQLAEGMHYLRDGDGASRFHFTVAGDFRSAFEAGLATARRNLGAGGEHLEVAFSEQRPSTHALALDEAGRPARTADGRLMLRPAGHGALLGNLAATGGDLVFVKNIDNLLPEGRHPEIAHWKHLLAGKLLEVEAARGRGSNGRPWRVCGVVANSGEPGGGPFWVENAQGEPSLQIVESAEVAAGDPVQAQIFRGSTHFNPVDLVVALRDPGRPAVGCRALRRPLPRSRGGEVRRWKEAADLRAPGAVERRDGRLEHPLRRAPGLDLRAGQDGARSRPSRTPRPYPFGFAKALSRTVRCLGSTPFARRFS
jgi:hypothetical protein